MAASPAYAQTTGNDSANGGDSGKVTLRGGGFGHAVGLSQYGAYGRALIGHTYDEILGFYYHDTTLASITDFEAFDPKRVADTVEVKVGVRDKIAISTPLDELGPGEWELSVEVDGTVVGVSTLPLTTYYDGTRWHAEYTDRSAGATTDICDGQVLCENTVLEVAHTIGARAVIEEYEDGPNLGAYLGGRYLLRPAAVAVGGTTNADCGSGLEFCITHSRAAPEESGRLNVLIGVREVVAIATPLDELGPGEWQLSVEAGGEVVGVSTLPLTTSYDGTRWHAEYTDRSTGATIDLCDNDSRCFDTALEVVQTVGTRAVVEEYEDGPNLGSYAGARYLLHPASVSLNGSAPDRCGTGRQFCVVVARLDMEKYLYGIEEVPTDWPFEALKAQAVAARSYAAATVVERAADNSWADEPFNLYDSTADQVFTGWANESGCSEHSWCVAVDATATQVVAYQAEVSSDEEPGSADQTDSVPGGDAGKPVVREPRIAQAFYSSSNGGHTAKPSDIWSDGIDLPFLVPKPDPFDAAVDPGTGLAQNPNAQWTRSYSVAELTRWLNNYTIRGEAPLRISALRGIEISSAPESGHVIFAEVTVHDEGRSTTLTRDGEPYGAWLFYAILNGCTTASGCQPPIGSQFTIEWPSSSTAPQIPEEPDDLPEEPEEPTFVPVQVPEFRDLSPDQHFYEPVLWAVAEEISSGAAPERFGPEEQISRAEFAEILWRFEGSPKPVKRTGFADIAADAPYRDAVDLLAEYQVVNGTSPTTFSPDMTVTRAQASTFLWRFAGMPEVANVSSSFTDVAEGAYYSEAVRWMAEHGITTGTSPTTFSPNEPVTRAAVVTFIWRLAGLPEAFTPRILQSALPAKMRIRPFL